jgi:hypothetical protein
MNYQSAKSAITGYGWYTIQAIHGVDPVSFILDWRSESINYAIMKSSNVFTVEQKHHLLV